MTDGFSGFIEKARGFLFTPVEAFQRARTDNFQSAFIYYLILIVINAILTGLVYLLGVAVAPSVMGVPWAPTTGAEAGVAGFISGVIGSLIGNIIGLFVGGAIVHIFVYLLGGQRGIVETLKAFAYGDTPGQLFGWIPLVGFIAWLYTIYLWIVGIRELQEMTMTRAALAVIIPVLIAILLFILIIAALIAIFAGIMQQYTGMMP
jgi:hypothetical protein